MQVLLVEDNPADAAYVKAVLDEREFRLTVATRVHEAVDLLSARRVEVVLLDMSLPDGNGLEGLRAIQTAAPHVPVVILSGDDDERMATSAVRAGAQDYLLKGHASDVVLRRALHYAIDRQDSHDRLAASIEELERQRGNVLALNALKNDLIAVLAHDIKGPLTSIMGYAELIEEGALEGESLVDAARTIRSGANRLATLATDVLALSRIEHGDLEIADERVDLNAMLQSVVDEQDTGCDITLTSACAAAVVRGDEDRLRQVFDNLLRNAIKYAPEGSPIEIGVRQEGERFFIDVCDHGMGIPADEIPRLFERFSRASNAKKAKIAGSGIGLFIVKMIVERHGGEIAVESVLGEGSTFTVVLPTLDAPITQRSMRVTIVTADSNLRRFVAYELRARGFRVRECAGVADLSHVRDIRERDVMVIDTATAARSDVAAVVPRGMKVFYVGIGSADTEEYNALLTRPFLVEDLLQAVSVEA
ncbi:MAG: sensor histidine kinase [Vulcanimicrobiaceae bacterium]